MQRMRALHRRRDSGNLGNSGRWSHPRSRLCLLLSFRKRPQSAVVGLLASNRSWLSCFSRPEISAAAVFWTQEWGQTQKKDETNPSCGVICVLVGASLYGRRREQVPKRPPLVRNKWPPSGAVILRCGPRAAGLTRQQETPSCRLHGHCHERTCCTGAWSDRQFYPSARQCAAIWGYKGSSCSAIYVTYTNWRWRQDCPFINKVPCSWQSSSPLNLAVQDFKISNFHPGWTSNVWDSTRCEAAHAKLNVAIPHDAGFCEKACDGTPVLVIESIKTIVYRLSLWHRRLQRAIACYRWWSSSLRCTGSCFRFC